MRITILVPILAALALLPPLAVADDHGVWQFEARPYRVLPFPYVPRTSEAQVTVGPTFDGTPAWARPLPWRYQPDPGCRPPYCLPSYYRPVYPRPPGVAQPVPLAAILKRLQRLDYAAYGQVAVRGGNYQIEALDRHGQPVVVIVGAKTGQVRRVVH